jgi:dTDP-glucose pyrophosphorylase
MPVHGRPFLDYSLRALARAGCTSVALVVGPEQRDDFTRYVRSGGAGPLQLSLVEQDRPLGTADAVRAAHDWTGGEPFLVLNGDNLYPAAALRALTSLPGVGLAAFEAAELVAGSNIPPERIAEFATIDVTPDDALASIVEKPVHPTLDRLVSMNAWRFDARIVDACRDVAPSPRGEYELPSAVALAMSRGVRFTVVRAGGVVLDLSRQVDVAAVEAHLTRFEAQR